MPKTNVYFHAFNVGVHDKTALPRVDLERMRLAAETQTNMLPLAVGPGIMRPGLEYLSATDGNAVTRLKEFVFGASDAALMEFSATSFRVRNDDALVTRPSVSTAVTNGDFSADTGWTLTATAGGTATIASGVLTLAAVARGSKPSCVRSVTVSGGDQNVVHALRIVVTHGPVTFKCGSSSGGGEYIAATSLETGTHSLAFTPTGGTVYVYFETQTAFSKVVDSITVEAAGVMELTTPWAGADLDLLRFAQSADVVFVACAGYKPMRIERRGAESWSIVDYKTTGGPLEASPDFAKNVTMTVGATNGSNTTITSSSPFFSSGMVGALIRVNAGVQTFTTNLAGAEQYTGALQLFGQGGSLTFGVTIAGTWSGTLSLQESFNSADVGFADSVTSTTPVTYTGNGTAYREPVAAFNNVEAWFRVGFKAGNYTSGTAQVTLFWAGGFGYGTGRIVSVDSSTQVTVEVLDQFRSVYASKDWYIGEWSDSNIWPSAVALADGRLWFSGSDRLWGSVSDDFANFDPDTVGDSGPVSRSIATGGVNNTEWLLALQRLIVGTEGAVAVVKASSFDEPITPTNLSVRDISTIGVGAVEPARLDGGGVIVERAGRAVMEVAYNPNQSEYAVTQLSKLTTDLFSGGIKALAVQRRPDTRIWIVTEDGACICCLYEPSQEVIAFIPIETDGTFESVAVLPSTAQDRVYFVVNRTIDSSTVRYVEKMALDTESAPATQCKVMDAFAYGTNSPASTTVPVGTHLEGETVVVWADGAPVETSAGVRGEYVVDSSGNITVGSEVTNWVCGLPYRLRYKSARLAYAAAGGTAMLQKKTVDELGLILTDFVRKGVKTGASFDKMYELPTKILGQTPDAVVSSTVSDESPFTLGGGWSLDSRVCIEVNSPYTMKALGMSVMVTTHG